MSEIATVGLDLAKNVFQAHGADLSGRAVLRKKLRRDQVLAFFCQLSPCVVAMEACNRDPGGGRRQPKKRLKRRVGREEGFLFRRRGRAGEGPEFHIPVYAGRRPLPVRAQNGS